MTTEKLGSRTRHRARGCCRETGGDREHVAAAISVSGLVKRFGATRALDGLDLMVRSGEVHGFLGPNGAGKTTTVRVCWGCYGETAAESHCLAVTRGGMR